MSEIVNIDDNTQAYLAKPAGKIKAGIIVIHEVWGLTDHIKSVADRLAAEGYLALAPDLMSWSDINTAALSGFQEALFDPERRSAIQPKLRELMAPLQNPEFGKTVIDMTEGCFEYLYKLPETKQLVAVIGFCFGGTYSYSLAVNESRLKLAIPFYGHADFSVEELKHISCPVRAFYGKNDDGLADQMQELPAMMEAAGVDFEQKIYPDCGHAFFNDTNRFAYNRVVADDAWRRVLTELNQVKY